MFFPRLKINFLLKFKYGDNMKYTNYLKCNFLNLTNNINYFKNNNYQYIIMDVSNNFHHLGMYLIKYLNDISYLLVHHLNDVILIRKYDKEIPIIYDGELNLDNVYDLALYNVIFALSDITIFNDLNIKDIKIILKIDMQGLNGINSKMQILDIVEFSQNHKLMIEGIMGKIAEKDFDDFKYMISPLNNLNIICLNNELDKNKIILSNAIKLDYSLLGFYEGKKGLFKKEENPLKQVFTLYSEIINIKKETIKKKEVITGVIPLGYQTGMPPFISEVWINNKLFKIIDVFDNVTTIVGDEALKIHDVVEVTSQNNPLNKFFSDPLIFLNAFDSNLPIIYDEENLFVA